MANEQAKASLNERKNNLVERLAQINAKLANSDFADKYSILIERKTNVEKDIADLDAQLATLN